MALFAKLKESLWIEKLIQENGRKDLEQSANNNSSNKGNSKRMENLTQVLPRTTLFTTTTNKTIT
mgnify:CR=1 FL=1|jgi:hypothetical protein